MCRKRVVRLHLPQIPQLDTIVFRTGRKLFFRFFENQLYCISIAIEISINDAFDMFL